MNAETLASKVWNFCHILRDDGVGYGDYLEQLTYLIFLKMAHEYMSRMCWWGRSLRTWSHRRRLELSPAGRQGKPPRRMTRRRWSPMASGPAQALSE